MTPIVATARTITQSIRAHMGRVPAAWYVSDAKFEAMCREHASRPYVSPLDTRAGADYVHLLVMGIQVRPLGAVARLLS